MCWASMCCGDGGVPGGDEGVCERPWGKWAAEILYLRGPCEKSLLNGTLRIWEFFWINNFPGNLAPLNPIAE